MAYLRNETGGGGGLLGTRRPKSSMQPALQPEGPHERGRKLIQQEWAHTHPSTSPEAGFSLYAQAGHVVVTAPIKPQEAAVSCPGPGLAWKFVT